MKKIILIAVFLVTVCISAKAQIDFGLKGGINYSSINADDIKTSTVAGYQAGVFMRFGGRLYVQPELYLNSSGGSFTSEDNAHTAKIKFTNLSIPVLLGYAFGPKALKFRIMAGPIYTAALGYNLTNTFDSAYNDFGTYNKSTWGYQAGAGIDLGPFFADLRYQGSFNDVYPNYGKKQELWAFSVGLKIF